MCSYSTYNYTHQHLRIPRRSDCTEARDEVLVAVTKIIRPLTRSLSLSLRTPPTLITPASVPGSMHRIDTTDPTDRWRYRCPECGSTDWRADDGKFGCRNCGRTLAALEDRRTGERVARERIEFVGPESSWKAPYATRRSD